MNILEKRTIKYTLIIPAYNAAKTLKKLAEELISNLKSIENELEIIFIDDCSQDESWNELLQIQEKYSFVRIIRLAKNVGQFVATTCGINKAKGLIIITLDDDLQYSSSDIMPLIDFYHQQNHVLVYGIPKQIAAKKINTLFTRLALWYLFRYLLRQKREVEAYSSLRIFNKEVLLSGGEGGFLPLKSDIDSYCNLHLNQKYIGFFEVSHQTRKTGSSGYSFWDKVNLLFTLNRSYLDSPLRFNTYIVLFIVMLNVLSFFMIKKTVNLILVLCIMNLLLLSLTIISVTILAFYVNFIYKKHNNQPPYLIVEEY